MLFCQHLCCAQLCCNSRREVVVVVVAAAAEEAVKTIRIQHIKGRKYFVEPTRLHRFTKVIGKNLIVEEFAIAKTKISEPSTSAAQNIMKTVR